MSLRTVVIASVIGAVAAGAAIVVVYALPKLGEDGDNDRRPPRADNPVCSPRPSQTSGALPPGTSFSFEAETPGASGISITHAATFAAGEISVDEHGRDWQSGTVTVDQKLTAKGESQLRGINAGGHVSSGTNLSYQLVVPAAQASSLARIHPPTPFDPQAIPVGGSVSMGKGTYAGAGLSAGYKALTVSLSFEAGVEVSTAVSRLDRNRVRVVVGPSTYVNEGVSLGLGNEDVSLNVDLARRISESHLDQFDFDLSHPGDEDSYYALVFGGQAPTSVRDRAMISGLDYAVKRGLSLEVRNFGATLGTSSGGSLLVTTHADQRVEVHSAVKDGDRTATRDDEFNPDGSHRADRTILRLILRNAGNDELRWYNAIYANRPNVKITGAQNFVLTFTPDDFEEFRYQALEILAYTIRIDEQVNAHQFSDFRGDADPERVRKWLSGLNASDRESVAKRFENYPGPVVAEAYRAYTAEDDGVIVAQMWRRLQGPLVWLVDWSQVLTEARNGDDRIGVGEGLCRGVTKIGPPPKAVSCPLVGYIPNSDYGAFQIKSRLVLCKDVRTFLLALRSERGTSRSFTFRLFNCRMIKEDRSGLPSRTYHCEQGPRWFEWTT